jgi:alcohol dehydrogenase (cytochrome c)
VMKMNLKHRCGPGLVLVMLGFHGQVSAQAPATTPAEFTAGQSAEGKTAYDRACLQCHGRYLDDGQFAPALRGAAFGQKWNGQPADQLFTYVSTKMPPDAPGSLNARAYAAITAYILQSNGNAPG